MCFLEQYRKQMKAIMCCLFPLSRFSGLFSAEGTFCSCQLLFFFLFWMRKQQNHEAKVLKPKKPEQLSAPYLSTHQIIKVTGNTVEVSARIIWMLPWRFESFYSLTVTCVRLSTCRSPIFLFHFHTGSLENKDTELKCMAPLNGKSPPNASEINLYHLCKKKRGSEQISV